MSFDFSQYPRWEIPEGRVKQVARASDGLVLWKAGYINAVPLSTTSDGNTIYNNKGYKDGVRLNSSAKETSQSNTTTTGFIPAVYGQPIRMSGVNWGYNPGSGAYYNYIQFYNEDFSLSVTINLYCLDGNINTGISNISGTKGGWINTSKSTITTDSNGVTTFNIVFTKDPGYSYIRIAANGTGANMIVTVDEEIV